MFRLQPFHVCLCFQGKSLALICGAVRWLKDHEERELADAEAAVTQLRGSGRAAEVGAGPDDWIAEQGAQRERRRQLQEAEKRLEAVRRARARAAVRPGRRRPEKVRAPSPGSI